MYKEVISIQVLSTIISLYTRVEEPGIPVKKYFSEPGIFPREFPGIFNQKYRQFP